MVFFQQEFLNQVRIWLSSVSRRSCLADFGVQVMLRYQFLLISVSFISCAPMKPEFPLVQGYHLLTKKK